MCMHVMGCGLGGLDQRSIPQFFCLGPVIPKKKTEESEGDAERGRREQCEHTEFSLVRFRDQVINCLRSRSLCCMLISMFRLQANSQPRSPKFQPKHGRSIDELSPKLTSLAPFIGSLARFFHTRNVSSSYKFAAQTYLATRNKRKATSRTNGKNQTRLEL